MSPPPPAPPPDFLRNPLAVGSATDGVNGFNELNGAIFVATFVIGTSTYAIVASIDDYGVQLIDVSDPSSPVAVGSATDGVNGFDELDGPQGVATFVIGASTYAIAAARADDGVQLIDVSDPSSPAAVGSATDGVNGFTELKGAVSVATFVVGTSTYAIVASLTDNGVQIIDVSDPSSPVAVGSATDGVNGFTELQGAYAVAIFVIGTSTYAIVLGYYDDGVQLIDVSDPSSPVAVGSATDGVNGFDQLSSASAVATFVIGASTYAIVASNNDDGVQLIDVSDPSSPVAVGSATDGANGFDELDGTRGVATFVIGTSTYAIVASNKDDGVQLIDVSDPSSPVAVGSATDGVNGFDELNQASGVASFVIGTNTYAIVAGRVDDGVQLLQVGASLVDSPQPPPLPLSPPSSPSPPLPPPNPPWAITSSVRLRAPELQNPGCWDVWELEAHDKLLPTGADSKIALDAINLIDSNDDPNSGKYGIQNLIDGQTDYTDGPRPWGGRPGTGEPDPWMGLTGLSEMPASLRVGANSGTCTPVLGSSIFVEVRWEDGGLWVQLMPPIVVDDTGSTWYQAAWNTVALHVHQPSPCV